MSHGQVRVIKSSATKFYTMKLDMHLHSNISSDAITLPETIMKVAARKGITIAITDHNSIGAWPVFEKLSKELNQPVILGEEIKCVVKGKCVGEIVGLFMNEHVKRGSPEYVLDKLHEQNALAMVVHPFDSFRNAFLNIEQHIKKIDIVEVFNSRTYFSEHNSKAKELAMKYKLPMIANSDAHTPEEIGTSWTEVKADTIEEARRQLIQGRVSLHEVKSPVTVHLTTPLAKYGLIKDR